jgi:quinolinate synthase
MDNEHSLIISDESQIDPSLDLEEEINRLKKELNAVVLAHYYQDSEIQDVADFVGDSLDLSRKAAATNADVIVFCGVRFMAEVAKTLNPTRKVIIPDMNAGCSLEDACKAEDFAKFKAQYPDHLVLTYINSSLAVKGLTDIVVTSSNAERIINQIPESQPIIFAPDKHLGGYLSRKTGRDMVLWTGTCIVHEQFSEKELIKLKTNHPDAHVIAHPECPEHLLRHATHIGSTSSLLQYTKDHNGGTFIVLTEPGIIYQMRKLSPDSSFYDVPGTSDGACATCNDCPYMKLNSLEKLYMCMVNQTPEIHVSEDERLAAKRSLDKMIEMS